MQRLKPKPKPKNEQQWVYRWYDPKNIPNLKNNYVKQILTLSGDELYTSNPNMHYTFLKPSETR